MSLHALARTMDLSASSLAYLYGTRDELLGDIVADPSKPDGTPRKLMDSGKLRALGWAPSIGLEEGIAATYAWFLEHQV